MRAATRCIRARSINGSSLDQWMSDAACSATHRALAGACWRRARLIRITAALVAARAAASFYHLPSQSAQRAMPTYKEAEGNGGRWRVSEPDKMSMPRHAARRSQIGLNEAPFLTLRGGVSSADRRSGRREDERSDRGAREARPPPFGAWLRWGAEECGKKRKKDI